MNAKTIATLVCAALLISVAAAPATATAGTQAQVDECMNADEGPGGNGPPGFVADIVPNLISDLIGSLPVPNFVKSFFGASTC